METKNILLDKAGQLAHLVYTITKLFPKEEIYGITSQLRRAALSVPLNIVEGFARTSANDHRRFLKISYASLQEAKYLLLFSFEENLIKESHYYQVLAACDEVARILWTKIQRLK